MEKSISNFSLGLFLWQILIFLIIIVILYFVLKLYRKITKFLDKNTSN